MPKMMKFINLYFFTVNNNIKQKLRFAGKPRRLYSDRTREGSGLRIET